MSRKISKLSGASKWCLLVGFISFILLYLPLVTRLFGFMSLDGEEILTAVLLFLPLPSYLLGIVFASIARDLMRKSDGESGEKPGIGVALGIFFLLGHILVILMVYPFLQDERVCRRRSACMNNMFSLVQMAHMYAIGHDDTFPDSFKALAAAGYTIGNLTSCPSGPVGYGLNAVATKDCPPDTPLIGDFDSTNHGGIIFRRGKHAGNIGYVDGSVRMYIGAYSAGSGPLEDVAPEDWIRE